jgi:hypothetical protein
MIAIFFSFCVTTTPYTFQGRVKIGLVNFCKKISEYIPLPIRTSLINIIDYCFNKRNPIIQVSALYNMLDYLYVLGAGPLCYIRNIRR